MNDPYQVLGVSPSASDDEIKQAYRELAKKYHPDNYLNNPLADLASEKMKEINEAYDNIVKMRASGRSHQNSNTSSNQMYQQIRSYLNAGNIAMAEQMLLGMTNHDAEWHFLMGNVMLRKRWYDEAKRHFTTAYQMNPTNPEYSAALQRMQATQGQAYQSYQNNLCGGAGCCDCCTALICADMCCN